MDVKDVSLIILTTLSEFASVNNYLRETVAKQAERGRRVIGGSWLTSKS